MSTAGCAGIQKFVKEVATHLPDENLAAEVENAFRQGNEFTERVESCFDRLVERAWPRPTLERFFHGWHDTHLTSGSVAAVTCRLMTLAEQSDGDKALAFHRAANCNAKIIHEDLGLCGETHTALFYRLATSVCDGDTWMLNRNQVPSAVEFRKWVHHERVNSDEVQDGLLVTIASEIYNHGEYSFALPLLQRWLEQTLGLPEKQVRRDLEYVQVHTGDTESGHFMCGTEALKLYCAGAGVPVDYARIGQCCTEYLQRVGQAFDGIAARLN